MSLDFEYFFIKDSRPYSVAHRVDRAAKYINASKFSQFQTVWIHIIHAFSVTYTNCSPPTCDCNQNRVNEILKNVEGFDILVEDSEPEMTASQNVILTEASHTIASASNTNLISHGLTPLNIANLQKGIHAIVCLFPQTSRPSGEENQAFTARVTPILEQMNALRIPAYYRSAISFTLLVGKASKAASKLSLSRTTINKMLQDIKNFVSYDRSIQDCCILQCTNVTYSQILRHEEKNETATRKCTEHLTYHQKDLPNHLLAISTFPLAIETSSITFHGAQRCSNKQIYKRMLYPLHRD